jgi:hypothetical protein
MTEPISISARFAPSRDEIGKIRKLIQEELPEIGTALEVLPLDLFLYKELRKTKRQPLDSATLM